MPSFPIYRTFALLLSLCYILCSSAQTLQHEHITIEQGLSQGMVFDLCQTRDGFIWAATKGGLNRFDGYNFKVFVHDPFDPFSLSGNVVRDLFEDSRGLLWVATENNGLDVYNPRTGRFHRVFGQQADEISEGPDGSIWLIARYKALYRLKIPKEWADDLPKEALLHEAVAAEPITLQGFDAANEELVRFFVEKNGNLSVATSMKVYRMNAGETTAYPSDFEPFASKHIGQAYMDETITWLTDDQFEVLSVQSGHIQRYAAGQSTSVFSTYIKNDAQGGLWFLQGTRIWKLNGGHSLNFKKPDIELDREAVCILKDRNGGIWFGTNGYGLRHINPQRRMFHSNATGHSVWGLWRSPVGRYYWKRYMRICRFDPNTGETSTEPAFPQLGVLNTLDMVFEPDGHFWMLGKDDIAKTGWLWYFDAQENLQKSYPLPLNLYDQPRLVRDRDGSFWITGASGQLLRFDPQSEQIQQFYYAHLFGGPARTENALAFAQDGNGAYWVGTLNGLVKGVLSNGRLAFTLFQTDPNNHKGLNHNMIACILPDPAAPHQRLLIGTKGGGINCMNLNDNTIEHITTTGGLPDNVVYGILPEDDSSGRHTFWVSTNRGLARIGPTPRGGASVYTAAKGLQDNEFNTQAFFKASNGELMFGGVNGLNRFFPHEIQSDTTPPPVFVVGMEVNHKPFEYRGHEANLDAPIERARRLTLGHN